MVVSIVGAGGVATSLGVALQGGGHEVRQVWSRTEASARELAQRLSCAYTTDIKSLDPHVDYVLISVKDSEVGRLASQLPDDVFVIHTAGSVPLSVLPQARAGVIYPLQSFSRRRTVDVSEVPLFIETKQSDDLLPLLRLAETLNRECYYLNSDDRLHLHLAAVFASNFANHCYDLASRHIEQADLPFEVLLPLIDETARKVHELPPRQAQTGPAARWDEGVMSAHLGLLQGRERELYRLLSESIHERKAND